MAIFTMSDLHLSLSVDKPMNVFGSTWDNYMARIEQEWNSEVGMDDTVIVGGDISWAMRLCECFEDFKFIDSLNGFKILMKGNHDYWWESMAKMNKYISDNGFSTIAFMQNTAFLIENVLICGSRGWKLPGDAGFCGDDRKIYERELQRLEISLSLGAKLIKEKHSEPRKKVCFLHYPPFTREHKLDTGFENVLNKYGITDCIYGHLHAKAASNATEGTINSVSYKLVSSDFLGFRPLRI